MRKLTLVAFAVFAGTSLANESMTGAWQCKMVSEYGDFTFKLMLNDDKTFTKKQDMFGETSVGVGKWSIEGSELVMNREKYTKNGKEKASSQEFRREIVSVSVSALELKHDEITTSCTKA